MDALARHDVGHGDARSEHPYLHFTILGLGALFLEHLECVEPAVVGNDNARVFHSGGLQPGLTD